MGNIPLFIGFHTSQVVQDFSHQPYDPRLVSFTAMCMHGGGCITRWHPQNCLATSSTVSHSAWPLLRKNKHAFCVACAVKHELHNFLFDLNNVKIRSSLQRNLQKSLRLTTLLVVSTHPLQREKLSKRWVCSCSVHSTCTKALHRCLYHASVEETFSLWVLNIKYKWDLICASCWKNVVSHVGCFYQTIQPNYVELGVRSNPQWPSECDKASHISGAMYALVPRISCLPHCKGSLCLLTMRSFPKILLLQWPSHISIGHAVNMKCIKSNTRIQQGDFFWSGWLSPNRASSTWHNPAGHLTSLSTNSDMEPANHQDLSLRR